MLTILPMKEREFEEIKEFLQKHHRDAAVLEKSVAMVAKDGNAIIGVGLLSVLNGYGNINDIIVAPGCEAMQMDFGVGKALLNFIERRQIMDVYAGVGSESDPLVNVLKKLQFKEIETREAPEKFKECGKVFYLNLKNYFTSHC